MAAEWHGRKGRPWRRLRAQVLAEEPWCRHRCGRPAAHVDHIIPRSIRPDLAHHRPNLQGLCGPCNLAKATHAEGTYRCDGCTTAQPVTTRNWLTAP